MSEAESTLLIGAWVQAVKNGWPVEKTSSFTVAQCLTALDETELTDKNGDYIYKKHSKLSDDKLRVTEYYNNIYDEASYKADIDFSNKKYPDAASVPEVCGGKQI